MQPAQAEVPVAINGPGQGATLARNAKVTASTPQLTGHDFDEAYRGSGRSQSYS